MTLVSCSVNEQLVNPLFEVFDGGDFVLSSYRDVEQTETELRIFTDDPSRASEAVTKLIEAGQIFDLDLKPTISTIPDEDWKLSYRKHFKIDRLSERLWIVPEWEMADWQAAHANDNPQARALILDPGMAFGTGAHGTTRACLEFIDELAAENAKRTFLDVGCGSGILAIAAQLEGFDSVSGFDLDPDAVAAANANAQMNGVARVFVRGNLMTPPAKGDVVVANVLGPVLIRYAAEVASMVNRSPEARLILSGILEEVYPDVKAAYEAQGFKELSTRQIGEWKTGLFKW